MLMSAMRSAQGERLTRVATVAGRLTPIVFTGMMVAGLLACGSDESGSGRVASMLDPAAAPLDAASEAAGGNRPPRIESLRIEPPRPVPGRSVRAIAVVRDPDGDATTLSYVWQTASGRILGEGASLDTSGLDEGARIELVATADDGEDESEEFETVFEIGGASLDVAFVAIDTEDGTSPGAQLSAVVESTDDSAGRYDVEYEWLVDGRVVGSEEELDTTALSPGDAVYLRARIEYEGRRTRAVTSRPVVLGRGSPPRIVSNPTAGFEDGVFRYQLRAASDEPAARFVFEMLSGPEGMSVDPESGLVTWQPREDQRGAFEVELAAKDQWGSGVAQSFELQIDAPDAPPARAR